MAPAGNPPSNELQQIFQILLLKNASLRWSHSMKIEHNHHQPIKNPIACPFLVITRFGDSARFPGIVNRLRHLDDPPPFQYSQMLRTLLRNISHWSTTSQGSLLNRYLSGLPV